MKTGTYWFTTQKGGQLGIDGDNLYVEMSYEMNVPCFKIKLLNTGEEITLNKADNLEFLEKHGYLD